MIFRSPLAPVHIPEVSLTEFVLQRAAKLADKPALIDGLSGRTLTYAQLADAVRSVAANLAARGFMKGDVLAIYSPNLPEYAVALHAVATLGGIVTTVNPLYTADELAHQLEDAGAKYLLTVPALMETTRMAAASSGVREVFVFGEADGATPFAALVESDGVVERSAPGVEINPREDTVVLPYSSGTTGLPKGVMLTHYNLVANLCQIEAARHFDERDTLICVLPLFHIYGMIVIMNEGLSVGATIVTLPRFELESFLKCLQDYGVTLAHVVPPVALALASQESVDNYDLSRLRAVFSAAAPLGEAVARSCAARLRCSTLQGYGMTEASPATHMPLLGFGGVKDGSVGMCVPNMECKVVDTETGALLGANQPGELYVRGPQVMKGYLNRPDATAEAVDRDGWLRTGDIGYADEDGCFFIVDRAKELIKYKGFQVAPAELEAILLSHPSVADAAVIPSPDPEAGEVPKAFIVPRGECRVEEVLEFVAARVAPFKKIRKVELIEQIPKSPSGKILRRILVQRERSQQ